MTNLAGKHALVTGGGTGIGAAVALALAEAGATITICGRRREPLDATAARHHNVHAEPADVTDQKSVLGLYDRAQAARGNFAIVVANAGGAQSAPAIACTTINVIAECANATAAPTAYRIGEK